MTSDRSRDNARRARAWIEAMRLRTLPVSAGAVTAGIACGLRGDEFRVVPAIICMAFALIAQIVSNFANEYYDYKNGLDKKGREGFRRGVTEGDIRPEAMKRATYVLLGLDCLLGLTLIYWGGWWLIGVGIGIALFALAYSTGPYPLSHHGLGDLAVVVFFGIVPVGMTAYLTGGSSTDSTMDIIAGLGVGLLAANILIVNNYRDMEDDREVGKRTTVVIFGRKTMGTVYLVNCTAGLALIAWTYIATGGSYLWMAAWGILEILYIFVWKTMIKSRGQALNGILKRTAQLILLTSVVMIFASILA